MKRAIAAALLVLSLAACGDNGTPAPEAEKSKSKSKSTPAAETSIRTPSPAGAKVLILEPAEGATVKSPVTVKFGVEGMEVVPAGTDKPSSGHHHLLIDTKIDDYNSPIPADANHVHYGKGQTEVQIELAHGKHTLQDVFADMNHMPHDPPVESPVIAITVE